MKIFSWNGYTGAHELLHSLGITDHSNDEWNIMHYGVLRPSEPTGSKRITPTDETTIKGDSHVENQTP